MGKNLKVVGWGVKFSHLSLVVLKCMPIAEWMMRLLASFENASFAMLHLILKHAADVINEILIEEGKTFYMTNYGWGIAPYYVLWCWV